MADIFKLTKRYGKIITAFILLISVVWVMGMIVTPQILMVEYSFWHSDEHVRHEAWVEIDELNAHLNTIYAEIEEREQKSVTTGTVENENRLKELRLELATGESKLEELGKTAHFPPRVYGLKNYVHLGGHDLHRNVLLKTILASVFVTLIALMVCYPVAYYLAQVASKQTAALLFLGLIIPYIVSEILRAYAWFMLLAYQGTINTLLMKTGIIADPINFMGGSWGIVVGMTYAYILFMVFPIYNSLENLDRNQIDAAKDLGAEWWRVHWRIAIPHSKPGIATGCILTFMLAAGTFAIPVILGGPDTIWFTQIIYSWFFDGGNWNQGAAYAFVLLSVCIGFVLLMLKIFKVRVEEAIK